MQSLAHPLLLCSAVSTVGWEPKSCTKGLPEEFPSVWLGFDPAALTVFFTYILGLLRA